MCSQSKNVSIHKNSLFRLWAPLNKQVQDKGLSSEMLLGAVSCLSQHPDHCRSLQFANMISPSPPGSGHHMKPLWSPVSLHMTSPWLSSWLDTTVQGWVTLREENRLRICTRLWSWSCCKQLREQMSTGTCFPTANASSGHAFSPTPKCTCPFVQHDTKAEWLSAPYGGNWSVLLVH